MPGVLWILEGVWDVLAPPAAVFSLFGFGKEKASCQLDP